MRRRVMATCAVVALVVGLGAMAAGPAAPEGMRALVAQQAWAQNMDNADVPTDDTGVVTTDKSQEQGGSETAAEEGAAPGEGVEADAGQGESSPGQDAEVSTEGDGSASGGEDGAVGTAADPAQQAPALTVDPVFGSQRNADNLVNPQQKPDSSFIYDTSISALQEADSYLNDQTVQVKGEVVGDRLRAEFDEGYCWIVLQANEENYAEIPVFISQELTDLIDRYGSYGHKGTTLQVRGIFHLACPEHEGLTDLHADTVNVVEKGSVTEQVLDPQAFIPGALLVTLGIVMMLVFRHMREGQR